MKERKQQGDIVGDERQLAKEVNESMFDHFRKDRDRFSYASDIISNVTLTPEIITIPKNIDKAIEAIETGKKLGDVKGVEKGHPIRTMWTASNETVRRIIFGEVNWDNLPFDIMNDYWMSALAEDEQVPFVREHAAEKPLCEALDNMPCRREVCPLYKKMRGVNICKEFKLAFEKVSSKPQAQAVSHPREMRA